jgi:hypothetical protein
VRKRREKIESEEEQTRKYVWMPINMYGFL